MFLHVEPLAATLRAYAREGEFEAFAHFAWSTTLVWRGPEEVMIVALNGRLTPRFRSEIRAKLLELGVHRVTYLRRGRVVVRSK